MTTLGQPSDGQHDKPPTNGEGSLDDRKKEQQLKQEQAAFDQLQFQDKCFFILRVAMGVLAILAIPDTIYTCSRIILDPHQEVMVKRLAAGALFVSIIGLVGYVWRVFLSPASVSRLKPVTTADEASPTTTDQKSANQAVNFNSKPRRLSRAPIRWVLKNRLVSASIPLLLAWRR